MKYIPGTTFTTNVPRQVSSQIALGIPINRYADAHNTPTNTPKGLSPGKTYTIVNIRPFNENGIAKIKYTFCEKRANTRGEVFDMVFDGPNDADASIDRAQGIV